MLYLFASCVALLIGPLFYRFFNSGSGLQKGLDGFVFVTLGGLVLIHIFPELLHHGGFWSIFFVILGLWGPTLSERIFERYSELTHNLTLMLGIGGLLLHTLTDGGAMVLAEQEGNSPMLALGVILHRLPVGLALWWLLKPQVGVKWASLVLAAMIIITCSGYLAGTQFLTQLSLDNTVYLQAFVTGSILHVVLHQPHAHHEHVPDKQGRYEYQAGIGSLLGFCLLAALLLLDSGSHQQVQHNHSAEQLFNWVTQIAPVLLLTYLLATTRFALGLTPLTTRLELLWLQRLVGPEALVLTLLLLGPEVMLMQLIGVTILGLFFTLMKIKPIDPQPRQHISAWKFGFHQLVDRSAPWIILSLLLANLIGHPSVPLDTPLMQVLVLMLVFLPTRFCNLAGVILAISLAWSGWSDAAVVLALLASPILSWSQLRLMTITQGVILLALVALLVFLSENLFLVRHSILTLPDTIKTLTLIIITLLFSASLLRLGPRKFMRRLMITRTHNHHHAHEHKQHKE